MPQACWPLGLRASVRARINSAKCDLYASARFAGRAQPRSTVVVEVAAVSLSLSRFVAQQVVEQAAHPVKLEIAMCLGVELR